jgi:hypothetical protein
MKRSSFILIILVIVGAGIWALRRQRIALEEVRGAHRTRTKPAAAADAILAQSAGTVSERPSAELLRLRNEVTLLRQELEASVQPSWQPLSSSESAADWALVHSGPKPSENPGFLHFTNLVKNGFATPEAAFQSFNHAMRNQHLERLDNTRMKELWNVPDDFDDPNAKYSINMGEGMGGEIGYRIAGQESITPNQVRLTIDFERKDGSSFRREKILVEKDGRWRMEPAGLARAPESTPQQSVEQ